MPEQHALLPPSSAYRWVRCPGSVKFAWPFPSDGDAAAIEGTAAHWAMAEGLLGHLTAEGQITPQGTILTEEMLDSAEVVVEDVLATVSRYDPASSLLRIEERVSMARRIHRENWGTPDVVFLVPGIIFIWDFKHGHEFVDEFENWQLMDYAAGVCESIGMNGLLEQNTKIIMTVVQPRNYHRAGPVRRWEVMASELRAYWNQLEMAAEDAMSATPTVRPGPWCTHCPGRHNCQALQRDAYRSATLAQTATPVDLPPAAAALELRMLQDASKRLEQRIIGLQAQIEATLRAGQPVSGWMLEETKPREEWTVPVESVIQMAELLGVDARKPLAAITPPQLRKAGVPAEMVASMSRRPPGVMSLVRDDKSQMRRVFDGFVK